MTKDEIKAEIKRLQELLSRMEEEERLDSPHKQLKVTIYNFTHKKQTKILSV